jgi:Dyp-type peroxidase family
MADRLPLRDSEEIQGNVLGAFNKPHTTFLLLNFTNQQGARDWLKEVLPRVTTTNELEDWNKEFSEAKRASGGQDPPMQAVWVNVGLTIDGLDALAEDFDSLDDDLTRLADRWGGFAAFRQKPRARADSVGDRGRSAPETWLFGGPGQPDVDAVVTVAADEPEDLQTRLSEIEQHAATNGVTTIFRLEGNTLPGERAGHEHFGFKDGISQPGVRQFHEPDPDDHDERKGHPGTELVQPGEFVLGYRDEHHDDRDHNAIPGWMKDGSFQVLRRLAQDVPGFWAQMRQAEDLNDFEGGADRLAAKAVGRWRSGSPLAHAPHRDKPSARTPAKINDFEFEAEEAGEEDDPEGRRTPRFAHIRKTYPRAERFDDDRHRIMRRGIPYGLHFDPGLGRGHGRDAERGLIFNAHCADLAEQFEFIQQQWVNEPSFPPPEEDGGGGPNPGRDPVIGTGGKATYHETGPDQQLDFGRFVQTTGALYAFAPSISTLRRLANGNL